MNKTCLFLGWLFFPPNLLSNLCLNNASFLLLSGLPARILCLISPQVCVAYHVHICLKIPFLWFSSASSGITVTSKGNKYKCYIIYLESFQSWPDPLSSFILGHIFIVSLSSSSPGQDSGSSPMGQWAKEGLNLFCWISCWGKSDEVWEGAASKYRARNQLNLSM